jgi:hypothetical protein
MRKLSFVLVFCGGLVLGLVAGLTYGKLQTDKAEAKVMAMLRITDEMGARAKAELHASLYDRLVPQAAQPQNDALALVMAMRARDAEAQVEVARIQARAQADAETARRYERDYERFYGRRDRTR